MDPNRQNQIATAPPQEWNMDKSSPNNDPAPPPYQGFHYPGSFQPGVGFPQPQQVERDNENRYLMYIIWVIYYFVICMSAGLFQMSEIMF